MRLSDCAWLAVGLVLTFAVRAHLAGFDPQLAGLILFARGVAGAWLGAGPRGRARGRARVLATATWGVQAINDLTADPDRGQRSRVPLKDLLVRPVGRRSSWGH